MLKRASIKNNNKNVLQGTLSLLTQQQNMMQKEPEQTSGLIAEQNLQLKCQISNFIDNLQKHALLDVDEEVQKTLGLKKVNEVQEPSLPTIAEESKEPFRRSKL